MQAPGGWHSIREKQSDLCGHKVRQHVWDLRIIRIVDESGTILIAGEREYDAANLI